MLIRSATSDDVPAILRIEKEAQLAAHWTEEKYRTMLAEGNSSRVVLVLEDQKKVQGFAIGNVLDRECEIENLVIACTARRRGCGTELLRWLMDAVQKIGVTMIFLEVRESNLAARALYNRLSFVEHGRRKQYYRQPEEDGIMYRFVVPSVTSSQ